LSRLNLVEVHNVGGWLSGPPPQVLSGTSSTIHILLSGEIRKEKGFLEFADLLNTFPDTPLFQHFHFTVQKNMGQNFDELTPSKERLYSANFPNVTLMDSDLPPQVYTKLKSETDVGAYFGCFCRGPVCGKNHIDDSDDLIRRML